MKPLSASTRDRIIQMLKENRSSRQISSKLAVSHSTVNRIRSQHVPEVSKSKAGRPKKISATTERWMVREITSGKVDNAAQLKRQVRRLMGTHLSIDTVRRSLKKQGLKAAVKKKRPRLLARHKKERLDFAKRYQHWTVEDWKRVIWSDETKINRIGSDGRQWVWKRSGEALSDRSVQGTVKFGGGSLMVWGCMTALGVGFATRIEGGIDAKLYVSILDDELQQSIDYYNLDRDTIIFQQDNDPKHTSNLATNWFIGHEMEVLQWPAQSPELNPIEHLWFYLKQQLAAYETEPQSIQALWERVEAEWNKIPTQTCLNLIESMPRRVAAVLKAKGGYSKY